MASDIQDRARRTNTAWTAGPVYLTIRSLVRCLLWPYFRTRVSGLEHIPPGGPVILAPVHRSNLDSLMLSPLTRRRLRALAKESLFEAAPMAWLMASLGAFPVRRDSADRESMRIARELLAEENLLLVFPEGRGTKVTGWPSCSTGRRGWRRGRDPGSCPWA